MPQGKDWYDWRYQLANRITSPEVLPPNNLPLPPKDQFHQIRRQLPMGITPYYLSLMDLSNPEDPLAKMAIPRIDELQISADTTPDPICENTHALFPGVIRRYPDRILILTTADCPVFCRHCTRRAMGRDNIVPTSSSGFKRILSFIKNTPEIKDVILSGGDPLLLETEPLIDMVYQLRAIDSVEIIRIATRAPVTLPMRVDNQLVTALAEWGPIYINTHFNHPNELTEDAIKAVSLFVDGGIGVNNQSVLLKGINDDETTLKNLCRTLLRSRIRPYYLFMCDLVQGTDHFRVSLKRAQELMDSLRGHVSGLAIPTLVVDLPGGHGKIPVSNLHILRETDSHVWLSAPNGKPIKYPK